MLARLGLQKCDRDRALIDRQLFWIDSMQPDVLHQTIYGTIRDCFSEQELLRKLRHVMEHPILRSTSYG